MKSNKKIIYFLAAFLAAGFLAAFLAAGFLAAGFLAALGLAAFLAAGFLAALGFLAFLALGFLAAGSLAGSLKEPAPFLPAAAAGTTFLAATSFLRASFTRTAALSASATLLLATTYLRMAWREDPFLSLRALMAATIMLAYGGWAAGLAAFFTLGALATLGAFSSAMVDVCWRTGRASLPM